MSTQPIERRRLPIVRRRRPGTSRVVTIGLVFAAVFAAAFLLGHTRAGSGVVAEQLPPSLPTVATPVPAALSSAPPIEVGVAAPPATSKAPAKTTGTATSTATAPVQPSAPVVTPKTLAPATTTAPKTVTAPTPAAPKVPASGGSPAAPTTGGPSGSGSPKGGSGSGQGTSFDSSG
jgi:hypothetical protein